MESPTKTDLLDGLGKFIPLGSIIIIFLSAVKQILYYKAFNIDIIDYMTITEFLILFMEELVLMVLIILAPIGLVWVVLSLKQLPSKGKEEDLKLPKWMNYVIVFLVSYLGVLVFAPFFIFDVVHATLLLAAIFLIWSLLFSFIIIFLRTLKTELQYTIPLIVTWALYILFFTTFISINKVKNNSVKRDYSILFEGVEITTDEDLVYVGKTDKHLFLYEITEKKSIILMTDGISQIIISGKSTDKD